MLVRYTALSLRPFFLLALITACSPSIHQQPIGEEIPPDDELIALEAFRSKDRYYLRYQRGGAIFYAAGDLLRPVPGDDPTQAATFDVPQLAPMARHRPEEWTRLTRNMVTIPVLSITEWARFRDRLFDEFLPKEPNTGVSVSFDRADYFFFIDSEGRFRARRLIDKPPWYSVAKQVDLTQYFEKWQPALAEFLAQRGIHSEEVLFNTGDLEEGAIPFVYINTRTRLIVLVRYDELPDSVRDSVPGSHILLSLWHFIGTHTYSVPMRPFSSIQSLLAVVTDTALETGRTLTSGIPAGNPGPLNNTGPGMSLVDWEAELDKRLGRPASRGTLKFLVDGEAFFTRLVDAVASASTSIDVRAYIFDNDDVALTIAELLKRRANEGVQVRVLFDGLGTFFAGGTRSDSQPEDSGGPPSMQAWLERDSLVDVRTVKNFWLTGDHTKSIIIDGERAFLGGMNIGREYRYDWHDLMVEVTGPVVDEVSDEFRSAWTHSGFFGDFATLFGGRKSGKNAARPGYAVRLIYTKPGRQEIFSLQRSAIQRAQRYIYVENAYFTDDTLLKELILARRRGIDVRVIIPLETDNGAITRNIVLAANVMLENGIRVYIYPGFTHVKAAIFDGWASLGSANLDRFSLRLNQELNIATSEPEAVAELQNVLFQPDFKRSLELTEPIPEHWTDYLIELFGDYVF